MTKSRIPHVEPHGYKSVALKEARAIVKELGYKLPHAGHERNLGGGLWLANLNTQLTIGPPKAYELRRYE